MSFPGPSLILTEERLARPGRSTFLKSRRTLHRPREVRRLSRVLGRLRHDIAEILDLARPDLHVPGDHVTQQVGLIEELEGVRFPGNQALDAEAARLADSG